MHSNMNYANELEDSLRFLKSDKALRMLAADAYWPKWDSPWWHMLLHYEMGLGREIPENAVSAYITALNKIPLKIFPIQPGDMPADVDPFRGTPCHCQLGNVYQVLAARGVDVDQDLPWIRPWFLRYQMADGGLNCDNDAYLVKEEVPSSMVGTIPVFEAILLFTRREWTAEEREFLRKGADFLIGRTLTQGSATKHNASELESAKRWKELCFPRYYFYDVLRGLNALTLWAEKTKSTLPTAACKEVVEFMNESFPDGEVRSDRLGYFGTGTISQSAEGEWQRRQPATFFPLLEKVSAVGEVSPFLSRQWQSVRDRLVRLNYSSPMSSTR